MSQSSLLLAITWLVTCLAVLVAGLAVCLAPVEKTVAFPLVGPWQGATSATGIFALLLAAGAGLSLILFSTSAKEGNRARSFGELLVFFPLLFAYVWFLLPPGKPDTISIVVGLTFLAASGFLLFRSPSLISQNTWKGKKSNLIVDGCLVLFPVLTGFLLGHSPDLKAGGLSLFLYPLYAFVQLGVFLYIPVTRLRAMGVSAKNSTLLSALVFSLIHWPNPLVMMVTFTCMLIWANQYQGGRRLWQLALVMGLAATTFSQFLPDDMTRHMRVGPGYVRSEATTILADNCSIGNLSEYLEFVYPQTIGRTVLPEEILAWENLVDKARPSTWAAMFLISTESRKHLAKAGEELPPSDSIHWTAWPEDWKNRIEFFASENYWEKSGSTMDGFVGSLYRDILGRGASQNELNGWKTTLTTNQKRRISEVLLDWRLEQGQMAFTGMDIEEFRLPN